jgi:hypothetical protein
LPLPRRPTTSETDASNFVSVGDGINISFMG